MEEHQIIIDQISSELRRGLLVISVLSSLNTAKYGYALIQYLESKHIPIEGNTLYPLLRRLEKQGLLDSQWEVETTKPRKYYQITSKGRNILESLTGIWNESVYHMTELLGGNNHE